MFMNQPTTTTILIWMPMMMHRQEAVVANPPATPIHCVVRRDKMGVIGLNGEEKGDHHGLAPLRK
jgi:hypothetical protein